MATAVKDDPVLSRFRAAVGAAYGDDVERMVLYGSRARGDARPDSDYDIAVFLRAMPDRGQAMNRLADIGTDILYEVGSVVHAMPYRAGSYRERTPLMQQIRQDGVDL
jgi:predicted nucleotidyltransferase